jgi:ketosteroid isomerase-like protein
MKQISRALKTWLWGALTALSLAYGTAYAVSISLDDFDPLERAWDSAYLKGDVDALDSLWADDITIVLPGIRPMTKPEALVLAKTERAMLTRYESTPYRSVEIQDTAVVTGSITRTRNVGGKFKTEHWNYEKTYMRTHAAWKVVAFVATPTSKM